MALTACSSSSKSASPAAKGGVTTIKFIAADYGDPASGNSSTDYWNGVAKSFEAANPKIKVDVQVINWNDIDSKVATMIQGGNYPDVLQTGGYANFVTDNLLYKASDVLSPSTQANFIPSFSKNGEVGGTQYGIPFDSSTRVLIYNTKMFADAKITAAPTTWDELAADATKIKAKEPSGTIPYALPLGPEEAQGESMIWMLGNGGSYTDSSGKFTLNSAANIGAFQWLKDNIVSKGLTYANPASTGRSTAFSDFAAGKVGMLMGHPGLLPALTKANMTNWKAAVIPGKTGPLASTLGVADWAMAFKHNGNQAADKAWLDYIYSDTNTMKFLSEYNLMPVTTSDSATMTSDPKFASLKLFLGQLPAASFYPLTTPGWDETSAAIKKEIGTAVTGDPKQVLGDLESKATAAQANAK